MCTPPLAVVEPHPLADPARIDSVADGIDTSGAVLAWHDGVGIEGAESSGLARLPVCGVDTRNGDADAHLSWRRRRLREVSDLEPPGVGAGDLITSSKHGERIPICMY